MLFCDLVQYIKGEIILNKYFIFDFDGTIVDSKDIFILVYNQIAQKYNLKPLEMRDIETLKGLNLKKKCAFLRIPMLKLVFYAPEFYSLYKDNINRLKLFKGIKELLIELKNKGFNLAIISSNSESNIQEFLKNNNIDFISDIFCSRNLFGKDKILYKFLKEKSVNVQDISIYRG